MTICPFTSNAFFELANEEHRIGQDLHAAVKTQFELLRDLLKAHGELLTAIAPENKDAAEHMTALLKVREAGVAALLNHKVRTTAAHAKFDVAASGQPIPYPACTPVTEQQ